MASKLHFHRVPAVIGATMGATVISVISESTGVVPRPKQTLLPLLVVLFLISYGLMALLVVEQGRTIDSQRTLIQQLFSDSTELSHLKGKVMQDQRAQAQLHAKNPSQAHPQAPAASTQVAPQVKENDKNSAAKYRKALPQKPSPQDGQEMADERRSLRSI
jgi:hypothetical protein